MKDTYNKYQWAFNGDHSTCSNMNPLLFQALFKHIHLQNNKITSCHNIFDVSSSCAPVNYFPNTSN